MVMIMQTRATRISMLVMNLVSSYITGTEIMRDYVTAQEVQLYWLSDAS